jgi:hypothetical protein
VKCSHSNTTGFTNSALGGKWRRPEGTANEPINAAEARIIEILEECGEDTETAFRADADATWRIFELYSRQRQKRHVRLACTRYAFVGFLASI